MYKYYNANKLGNFVNDCTIRAISLAEGNSWDYTYDKMSDLAQQRGTMMDDSKFIEDYLDERYERIPNIPRSVGEVAGEYPDKVLLITMDGHITCSMIGGIIYDSFDCRRRIAKAAWIVKKEVL